MPRILQLNFRSVPSPHAVEWTHILGRSKSSGLSGRAFYWREGLGEPVFYSWKRKLRLLEEAGARRRGRGGGGFKGAGSGPADGCHPRIPTLPIVRLNA